MYIHGTWWTFLFQLMSWWLQRSPISTLFTHGWDLQQWGSSLYRWKIQLLRKKLSSIRLKFLLLQRKWTRNIKISLEFVFLELSVCLPSFSDWEKPFIFVYQLIYCPFVRIFGNYWKANTCLLVHSACTRW